MNHCCSAENLQAYLDKELSPDECTRVAAHLAECTVCAASVLEAEQAMMMIDSAWANELPVMIPTARLQARVHTALTEQAAPRFALVWLWDWKIAAVAVVLLVTLSLLFLRQENKPSLEPRIVDRMVQNESPQDNLVMTTKTSTTTHSIKSESHRRLRSPQSQRTHPPQPRALIIPETVVAKAHESEDATEFIPLRYGDDHPPMESGEVVRVQMPRSALVALGLPMDVERADKPVKADLLIGEDGQARAIRFVR